MPIQPGTRLGPYEITRLIGEGGMGEVFSARDSRLGRNVAIKILPSEFGQNAPLKIRFEREAEVISSLEHPHICSLFDTGEGSLGEGPISFIVMELLDGETLASRLQRGPLPIPEVLTIGMQIADGLDKAHRAGLVHRDLKPGHVMLTASGAKLLDLGLARWETMLNVSEGDTQNKPGNMQGPSAVLLRYLPPEQLDGAEIDPRGDIFSLGAMLFEMTTGEPAFKGSDGARVIASIFRDDPPPVRERRPDAPSLLEKVITKCLQKRRSRRWQSAFDLADVLRWMVHGVAI